MKTKKTNLQAPESERNSVKRLMYVGGVPGGFMAVRDGGRPDGEVSTDAGVLVVIDDVVAPVPDDVDAVATDATVPRSSLANCSLALGFDAHALLLLLLLMPLPVGSSAPSSDILVLKIITQRRSITKSVGCFQRRLVCVFVCFSTR